MWSKYLPKKTTIAPVAGAARWVEFIAQTLQEAGELSGIDAEDKATYTAVSKQLRTKGSDVRIEMLAQMDPGHRELGEALFAANQYGALAQRQFQQVCSRGVNPYNFTQCSSLSERVQKYHHFVQTYAPHYQAAKTQDPMLSQLSQWGTQTGTMNFQMATSPFGSSMTSPISAMPGNGWAQAGTVQPMNTIMNTYPTYQHQNFNPMYQNSAQVNSNSGLQVHRDLPVAIPLSIQGLPSFPMRS
jgi:hypothetical protein